MIQDIYPHEFHNEFYKVEPQKEDFAICCINNKILMIYEGDTYHFPKFNELPDSVMDLPINYGYSIDDKKYFIIMGINIDEDEHYRFCEESLFRSMDPLYMSFAGTLGCQIYRFYRDNKFCGRCGSSMELGIKERSMVCPKCHNTVYPKIAPAVIVGIIDNGKILMSRYRDRPYKKWGLIAGYTEFGETLEETVHREVMEEVGLKVKNIHYYKNQPWPFTESMLVGFYAELDGSSVITRDEDELAEARWFLPEEIDDNPPRNSLTNEMIDNFKLGKL